MTLADVWTDVKTGHYVRLLMNSDGGAYLEVADGPERGFIVPDAEAVSYCARRIRESQEFACDLYEAVDGLRDRVAKYRYEERDPGTGSAKEVG